MATLNVRYGGQVVSIAEGETFSPQSFGTARVDFKVNSSSTLKFGLTTNTNAREYCKFQVRVGGQTVFIGRVSSTSYVSGEAVDYNGSLTTSRNTQLSSINISNGSNTNAANPGIRTDSGATYSKVTTATQLVTELGTDSAGSGNGTVPAANNPGVRVVTNATGSSHTTRTATEAIQTRTETWYSFYKANYMMSLTYNGTRTIKVPAVGANKVVTSTGSYYQTQNISYTYYTFAHTNYTSLSKAWSARTTSSNTSAYIGNLTQTTVSSTRVYASSVTNAISSSRTSAVNNSTVFITNGASITTYLVRYTTLKSTCTYSYYYTYKTCYSTSKWTYWTRVNYVYTQNRTLSAVAIKTYYSYYSSTRCSYWWTSCRKFTKSTWNASWTSAALITNVSETIHNMNV